MAQQFDVARVHGEVGALPHGLDVVELGNLSDIAGFATMQDGQASTFLAQAAALGIEPASQRRPFPGAVKLAMRIISPAPIIFGAAMVLPFLRRHGRNDFSCPEIDAGGAGAKLRELCHDTPRK